MLRCKIELRCTTHPFVFVHLILSLVWTETTYKCIYVIVIITLLHVPRVELTIYVEEVLELETENIFCEKKKG